MNFNLRVATSADHEDIAALIRASVRGLQTQYSSLQQEAALRTVFTIDSQLIADGTYFVALEEGVLAGCAGWSYRRTLYGGDHQVEKAQAEKLDPAVDTAKIRAIFVHPSFARRGLGSLLLSRAEGAAAKAGFCRLEMGSTLAGLDLYRKRGYSPVESIDVPVGGDLTIGVVRMVKVLPENTQPSSAKTGLRG